MRIARVVYVLAVVTAGREAVCEAVEQPRATVSPDEKARLLAAESSAQKALRAELARLTAEGQRICFNANIDGVHRVYRMGCDGTDVHCLTPELKWGGEHPHLSPDGRRITFVSEMDESVMEEVTRSSEKDRHLGEGTGIYVMRTGSGEPQPITVGLGPRWSPDGTKLVYYYKVHPRGRRVAIYDLQMKTEYVVNHKKIKTGIQYPVITPDGQYLFVCGKDGAVVRLKESGTRVSDDWHPLYRPFSYGCNVEFSRDTKWLVWVVDTGKDVGGWLKYAPFRPEERNVPVKRLPLGWDEKSVNYFPDFSPCGKYLVYAHGDAERGMASWLHESGLELCVTTFPDCRVTVRITWNGAANQHPQWWAPPAESGTESGN